MSTLVTTSNEHVNSTDQNQDWAAWAGGFSMLISATQAAKRYAKVVAARSQDLRVLGIGKEMGSMVDSYCNLQQPPYY